MTPILYESDEKEFWSKGLGPLSDAEKCTVTEERNGAYTLSMTYPIDGAQADKIANNRIIKADNAYDLKNQLFVIKTVTPIMTETGEISLSVYAEHISYITNDLSIPPELSLTGTAQQALDQWKDSLIGGDASGITVDSDVTNTSSTLLTIQNVANARQALGGVEGSILYCWKGEYRFDNLHISLKKQRGTTANTLLSYGRNLLTFEQEQNIAETYTTLYPYALVTAAGGMIQKLVTIDGYLVDSKYVSHYPNRKIKTHDFTSDFQNYRIGAKPSENAEEGVTYADLATIKKYLKGKALHFMTTNDIGVPKISTTITFADLSKTDDELAKFEKLSLCDKVPVRFEKLGINSTIKVTRTVWNVLADSYDSIELGDLATTIGETVASVSAETSAIKTKVNQASVTAQIAADGTHNIFRTDDETEPIAKKVGDLWYKTDGKYTSMYQWDGKAWVLIINTRDTADVRTELDQAKSDMAQAKTDAQTAYDEAIKATNTANGAKAQTAEALEQAKQANDSYTALAKEVTDNKSSADADYKQAQADIVQAQKDLASVNTDYQEAKAEIMQAQKDLASVTSTVTEVKKGQGELSTKVAGKVDKTTYQSYVTQTDKALSAKLTASDLNGYAKVADVKQTTDGLSASITKVHGNLAYQASELIGKKSFEDGDVGKWYCADFKTPATLQKGGPVNGFYNWVYSSTGSDLYYGTSWIPVKPGTKFYVEALCPNMKSVYNGLNITVSSYLYYEQDGKKCWARGPGATITPDRWGWVKGVVTVPDNVTRVLPCIATKDKNGKGGASYVAYASFVKLDEYTQNQLTTLSGKITATSDRLSSVYTKSETDAKLGTKVEQSTLTQTANGLSASIAGNTDKITKLTADVNGVKSTVADNTGKISTMSQTVNGIKTTVADHTGKISTMQTDINGVKTNVRNAQGDITTLQTDVSGVKTTVADHTGKITQLVTDVNGVKSSVSSKVDKTTYQSYVTQTDKALSTKLTASDLTGYAKTADVKQTTDGLSASITKVQGNLAYQASELIGKKSFEDSVVGNWRCSDLKTPATLQKGGPVNGFYNWVYSSTGSDLYYGTSRIPVKPGTKFYVEALCPNMKSVYNGLNIIVAACLRYEQGGKTHWAMGPSATITPDHWGWVKGVVTVPDNVTRVLPCIATKDTTGKGGASYVAYASFVKLDEYTQNQLTTLSGKITATSDRLSSVYTKSETDAKLKTKVEQSALTQTSNNLSASIAKNSKILSSIGLTSDTAYINANKIALNGKTLMSNAVINDAFIGSLSANKITTGTLNAAKVNLINVNASNITSGSLNSIKITSTGKDPSGTSSTTKIESGYIDTNVINCSDYIMVGKADPDPRKRWQTKQDSFGMWFTCPAKLNGHTGNSASDYQTEMQGFIGSEGWNYKNVTISGTGASGIQLALTSEQQWGKPYGGDHWRIGNWVKTENSNKSGDIRDGTLDPVMWYSCTGQGAAYADQLVIQKKTQFFDKANFQDGVRIGVTGANNGIRTAWVSWSDWGSNQKIPCIVQDADNWGGIAFPANGRTVLFTHDRRVTVADLPAHGGGYNGWGS